MAEGACQLVMRSNSYYGTSRRTLKTVSVELMLSSTTTSVGVTQKCTHSPLSRRVPWGWVIMLLERHITRCFGSITCKPLNRDSVLLHKTTN